MNDDLAPGYTYRGLGRIVGASLIVIANPVTVVLVPDLYPESVDLGAWRQDGIDRLRQETKATTGSPRPRAVSEAICCGGEPALLKPPAPIASRQLE